MAPVLLASVGTVDFNTITFYTITSGLCFALGLLLMVFTLLLKSTVLTRMSAWTLMTMALAFLIAGAGPHLPSWLPMAVVNVVLLASGLQLYSGVRAFVRQEPVRMDWLGLGVIALTMPLLFYWWYVDFDGIRRAIVFSTAAMVINARSAALLIGHLRQQRFRLTLFFMTSVLTGFAVWMALRVLYLAFGDAPPPELRSANPTTWPTVFTLNLLIALFVASLLATEIEGRHQRRRARAEGAGAEGEALRDKLRLIGGIVSVILISIAGEMGIAYLVTYQHEREQLQQENAAVNQTLSEHAQQLIYQADLVLRATRHLVEKQYPLAELDRFVQSMAVPQAFFEGVFLLNAEGDLVLPVRHHMPHARAFHRQYFQVHWDNAQDLLHIGPVAQGLVTGKRQFRISRRIQDAQGRFAGVVFIPMESTDFTEHYARVVPNTEKVVALLSTQDRLARAALTEADLQRHDEQQRFLAMISHELRTPMSVISMEVGPQTGSGESWVRVKRAVGEMTAIIDSTLQADQLSHRQLQARTAPCELGPLLSVLCAAVPTPERIELQSSGVLTVDTDSLLLRIVVGNLLDNALKYSAPDTPVRVRVAPLRTRAGDGVTVTVSNAPGAAGEPDPRQVFRKFYRTPGARRRTGSGLGLYIADGLARLLGGTLRYDRDAQGLHFTLWLPRHAPR